jgi:hypothetical protein
MRTDDAQAEESLGAIGLLDAQEILRRSHIRHMRGSGAVLAQEGLLREFAASTGQAASMHGLRLKLEHEYARRKTAHLICVVEGEDAAKALRWDLSIDSLLGCVLLFEYRVGGWNTGFFATGDSTGIGTVIAPAQLRGQVAALAASFVLQRGQMVLTCFRSAANFGSASIEPGQMVFPEGTQGLWAPQEREVRDELCLCPTYDRTLETLGKRTRTHLRYYRRRVLEETGCEFIGEAAGLISRGELGSLNAGSLEPIDQRTFDLQFRATAELAGGYVCGLRAADGQWLCLAGGWRQGDTSLLQWQMNAKGFPHLSLTTALRAFLIEQEVGLGSKRLCFHGGTLHSISHAFERDHAVDLLLRRRTLLAGGLARLMPYFAKEDTALANRGNFLVDALRSRELRWKAIS